MALSADPANAPVDDVVKPIVQLARAPAAVDDGNTVKLATDWGVVMVNALVDDFESDEVVTVVVADPVVVGLVSPVRTTETTSPEFTGLPSFSVHVTVVPLPLPQLLLTVSAVVVSVTVPPPRPRTRSPWREGHRDTAGRVGQSPGRRCREADRPVRLSRGRRGRRRHCHARHGLGRCYRDGRRNRLCVRRGRNRRAGRSGGRRIGHGIEHRCDHVAGIHRVAVVQSARHCCSAAIATAVADRLAGRGVGDESPSNDPRVVPVGRMAVTVPPVSMAPVDDVVKPIVQLARAPAAVDVGVTETFFTEVGEPAQAWSVESPNESPVTTAASNDEHIKTLVHRRPSPTRLRLPGTSRLLRRESACRV